MELLPGVALAAGEPKFNESSSIVGSVLINLELKLSQRLAFGSFSPYLAQE